MQHERFLLRLDRPCSHHPHGSNRNIPMKPSLPIYVDSSMLTTWRSCRRKHYWSSILGLYPSGQSVHLIAGAALAAGMETARRYVFNLPNPRNAKLEDMLESAYPAFVAEWGDYDAPDGHAKSFVNTFSALEAYLTEYHPATDVIQPYLRQDGTPTVEYTFSIPLEVLHPNGEPFVFVGRFDMLGMYMLPHGQVPVVVDEKTTSAFSFFWTDQWDLRGQFIGYVWACRQAGINLDRAAIRGIAIQKTQTKIQTAFPQYPVHRIDQWYRRLIWDVKNMRDAFTNCGWYDRPDQNNLEQSYPFNFGDACTAYGGCAFSTLCQVQDPEPFYSNYVKHRFNPLLKQPVEEIKSE